MTGRGLPPGAHAPRMIGCGPLTNRWDNPAHLLSFLSGRAVTVTKGQTRLASVYMRVHNGACMLTRTAFAATVWLFSSVYVAAQRIERVDDGKLPRFEVVSIKPVDPN